MNIKPLSHTTPQFYHLCLDFLWAGMRGTVGKEGTSSSEDDGGGLVHHTAVAVMIRNCRTKFFTICTNGQINGGRLTSKFSNLKFF